MSSRVLVLFAAAAACALLLCPSSALGGRVTQKVFTSPAHNVHHAELAEHIEGVVNLDDEASIQNVTCNADHSTISIWTRADGNQQALEVHVGDMIVSHKYCRSRTALLSMRHVQSVRAEGEHHLVVRTVSLPLDKVFKHLNMSTSTSLTKSDGQDSTKSEKKGKRAAGAQNLWDDGLDYVEGIASNAWTDFQNTVQKVSSELAGSISYSTSQPNDGTLFQFGWNQDLSPITLFTQDGMTLSCQNCQAVFEGITIIASLYVSNYAVQDNTRVLAHGTATAQATMQAQITRQWGPWSEDKQVAEILHPTLITLQIGPIPVPIVVSIPILAGYNIQASGQITAWAEVDVSATFEIGAHMQGGQWGPVTIFSHTASATTGASAELDMKFGGYVGPALRVSLADVIGFQVGLLPYGHAELDASYSSCTINYDVQLEVPLNGFINLFTTTDNQNFGNPSYEMGSNSGSCTGGSKRKFDAQAADTALTTSSAISLSIPEITIQTTAEDMKKNSGKGYISGACANVTCGMHGTCLRGVCVCSFGYNGKQCEERIAATQTCPQQCTVATAEDVKFCRHLVGQPLCVSNKTRVAELDRAAFDRARTTHPASDIGMACFQRALALQCELALPQCGAKNEIAPLCSETCAAVHDECGLHMGDGLEQCYRDADAAGGRAVESQAVQPSCARAEPAVKCVRPGEGQLKTCKHLLGQLVTLYTDVFVTLEQADLVVNQAVNQTTISGPCLETAIVSLCNNMMPPCGMTTQKPMGMCTEACSQVLGRCGAFTADDTHTFCSSSETSFVAKQDEACTEVNMDVVSKTASAVEAGRH